MKIRGNSIKIVDNKGDFIDDIDTDQIFHNRFLTITDQVEMGRHAFSNLAGWQDYPQKAVPNDILVCGANFGAGSSRQQAVGCFQALGVIAIVARSFASIYFRNAVNAGLPVVLAPDLSNNAISDGDELVLDIKKGEIHNLTTKMTITTIPASDVQLEILNAGGLLNLAE